MWAPFYTCWSLVNTHLLGNLNNMCGFEIDRTYIAHICTLHCGSCVRVFEEWWSSLERRRIAGSCHGMMRMYKVSPFAVNSETLFILSSVGLCRSFLRETVIIEVIFSRCHSFKNLHDFARFPGFMCGTSVALTDVTAHVTFACYKFLTSHFKVYDNLVIVFDRYFNETRWDSIHVFHGK